MSQKNMILNCSCSLPGGKRSMHHDTVHKFQLQELSLGNKKPQRGVSQSLSMTILLPFHNLSSINMIKVKHYMVITFDTTVSSAMGLFVKVIHCSGVPFLYYSHFLIFMRPEYPIDIYKYQAVCFTDTI